MVLEDSCVSRYISLLAPLPIRSRFLISGLPQYFLDGQNHVLIGQGKTSESKCGGVVDIGHPLEHRPEPL